MPLIERTLISTFLILALGATVNGVQAEWPRVAPVGSGFSVLMPAKPQEEFRPGDDITTHLFQVNTDDALYIVAYGDYAPSLRIKVDDELAENRDRFLKGVNAGLIESKKINLEGHAGLEFTGESDQAFFRSRLFIFGIRFHQIAIAMFKGRENAVNANRFFDSFHFTETKTIKP